MLGFLQRYPRLVAYGLVALCVGCLLWPRHSDDADPYAAAIIRAHTRKIQADEKALGESRASVVHDSVTVTRAVTRWRGITGDTVRLTDTVWVKQVLASGDSVVRSCTALLSSCALYRVRAESVIAGLQTENDALAAEVKALHPSRLRTAWDRVKLPLAFVAGAYVGARVTR